MTCWLNGEIVATKQASVSVYDHGLLYGDGVFEGLRFYNNRVFRATEHLCRLYESAKAIFLEIPYTQAEILTALQETLLAYPHAQGYLRLVVTRGIGSLGINPRSCQSATVFIIADALSFVAEQVYRDGARVITASTRSLPSDGLDPRIKSLNYLNHILARIEANQANADEAILLNQQGNVTEGTSDNLFIVKNDILYTPPISDGVLNGITRNIIVEIAQTINLDVRETSLSRFDLYNADECLLSGTAVELLPVKHIDERKMPRCRGPVFTALKQHLMETIQRETTN